MKILPFSLVVLVPKESFLRVVKVMTTIETNSDQLTLDKLRGNSMAALIPYCKDADQAERYVGRSWPPIIQGQLQIWCQNQDLYPPDRSFNATREWFTFELHRGLYDLTLDKEGDERRPVMAMLVRPKQAFVNWLNANKVEFVDDNIFVNFKVEILRQHCLAYLCTYLPSYAQLQEFIGQHFQTIFENELLIWCEDKTRWPDHTNLKVFYDFFEVECHASLFDLVTARLAVRPEGFFPVQRLRSSGS